MPAKQQKVICKIHCGHKGNGNWKFIYFTYEYWSREHQTVFPIRKSSFSYKVGLAISKTQNKPCCNSKAMGIHFPHNIRIRLA